MVFSGMKNVDVYLSGVSFLYAFMLGSICAAVVGICVHLLCFGVIKLVKMGNILSVLKARSLGCVLNVLRSGEQWLAASLAIRSALQSRRAL